MSAFETVTLLAGLVLIVIAALWLDLRLGLFIVGFALILVSIDPAALRRRSP